MLFKKEKKDYSLFDEISYTRHIVYDFRRRISILFENYRNQPYHKGYELEEIKREIDDKVDKLFSANSLDEANEDCLVKLIIGNVRKAVTDIEFQRLQHDDFLARYGAELRTDYFDISNILKIYENKLDTLKNNYSYTKKLYDSYTNVELED